MIEPDYQTVAIIFKKVKLRHDNYVLVPTEVALGYLDTYNLFTTENKEHCLSPATSVDILRDESNELVYSYPILIDELAEIHEEHDDTKLMAMYFMEIAKNLVVARIRNGEVTLHVEPLNELGQNKKAINAPNVLTKSKELKRLDHIDNFALEDYVKERVFDADDIVEDICTTIAMNYSATNAKEMKTLLSIGPTGSGKTMTYQVIAEYLGVPITIYDCNSLTSAGYVGKDIEDALREVYLNSERKIDIAQKSILVFDEVDKLAERGSDVKDVSVQQAMLKLLEGFKYRFPIIKNGAEIAFDTTFMTVACLGAFSSIFEQKRHALGFGAQSIEEVKYDVTDEDLIQYGMIRELVGRWKHMFVYKAQTPESLRRILLESKWSPLLMQQERYLKQFNTELIWDDSFIDAYIEEATKSKAGGRSLSKISANTFIKIDREVLRAHNANPKAKKKVLVNHETIYNNRKFQI